MHQVRRLSHHPSIISYDAVNEAGGFGLFSKFVMTTVAEEDPSRVIWPASPSQGWASGVDRLSGHPNGQPLVNQKWCGRLGCEDTKELHGPYLGDGGGLPTDAGSMPPAMAAAMPGGGKSMSSPIGAPKDLNTLLQPPCRRSCRSRQTIRQQPLHQIKIPRMVTTLPRYHQAAQATSCPSLA